MNMYYVLIFAACAVENFCYAGGFGWDTTIKIAQKHPLLSGSLSKNMASKFFYQLCKNDSNLIPAYAVTSVTQKDSCTLAIKQINLEKKIKSNVIGISIAKSHNRSPFSFDIVCDERQKFFRSIDYEREEAHFIEARDLKTDDEILHLEQGCIKNIPIYNVVKITCDDTPLYNTSASGPTTLLVSSFDIMVPVCSYFAAKNSAKYLTIEKIKSFSDTHARAWYQKVPLKD